MSFPVPTKIVFNTSTGSDTAGVASGAGPGDGVTGGSAITGTDASTDGTGLIVTVPDADLSNVATDGSHAIHLNTSSGRKWGRITAKANSGTGTAQVTVEIAYGTSLTSQTYAIGGKRNSITNADNLLIYGADWSSTQMTGWEWSLETDQTISTACGTSTADTMAIIRSSGTGSANRRTITQTSASTHCIAFQEQGILDNIKLENSNATPGDGLRTGNLSGGWFLRDCIFGDATNKLNNGVYRANLTALRCEFGHCTGTGVYMLATSAQLIGCSVHDNTTQGIYSNGSRVTLSFCVVESNGGDGIHGGEYTLIVNNCVIYDNGGCGINIDTDPFDVRHAKIVNHQMIVNCQITHNTLYGVCIRSGQTYSARFLPEVIYNCNFGTGGSANGSGDITVDDGVTSDDASDLDSSNLQVDPTYANAAAGDFESTNTTLRNAGLPQEDVVGTTTRFFNDIGVSWEVGAGGTTTNIIQQRRRVR